MLRKQVFNELKPFSVCLCVASYQIEGVPYIDVLDANGRLYEGCDFIHQGGGGTEVRALPHVGVEVVVSFEKTGSPYIIGVLEDPVDYKRTDSPVIKENGDCDFKKVALKDVLIKSGGSALICSNGGEGVFLTPKLRIQGLLEISDGGTVNQSVAVADPLINYLNQLQSEVQTLRDILSVVAPPLTGLLASAGEVQASIEITQALSNLPITITSPYDTIASEIAKIER